VRRGFHLADVLTIHLRKYVFGAVDAKKYIGSLL